MHDHTTISCYDCSALSSSRSLSASDCNRMGRKHTGAGCTAIGSDRIADRPSLQHGMNRFQRLEAGSWARGVLLVGKAPAGAHKS